MDPQDLYYRWAPVAAFVANSTVDLGLNTRVWRAFSSHSGTGYDVFGQVRARACECVCECVCAVPACCVDWNKAGQLAALLFFPSLP